MSYNFEDRVMEELLKAGHIILAMSPVKYNAKDFIVKLKKNFHIKVFFEKGSGAGHSHRIKVVVGNQEIPY
ncbi:hypothetical protein ThvES_00008060 [Thiovulum sp. ES]|nr:hypothetical protein ThvES_00008060 [Thiovulum sp. ES]